MKIRVIVLSVLGVVGWMFCMGVVSGQGVFKWGVASAAYQVEGGYQADGKGLSNWDVYTNEHKVTKAFTKRVQTGNVAINQYDREQYLKDFALMKTLGINAYRFSFSWSRLLPNGIGAVNEKGVLHYHQFLDDMLAMGIEPCGTLFHWDLPQALAEKGGFKNPEFVKWFEEYSNLIFREYGKKIKTFMTFNEPYIDLMLLGSITENIVAKKMIPFAMSSKQLAGKANAAHHLLMANAVAIKNYRAMNLGGEIGIALSLSPSIPQNPNKKKDVLAATILDGTHNRFFFRWGV